MGGGPGGGGGGGGAGGQGGWLGGGEGGGGGRQGRPMPRVLRVGADAAPAALASHDGEAHTAPQTLGGTQLRIRFVWARQAPNEPEELWRESG